MFIYSICGEYLLQHIYIYICLNAFIKDAYMCIYKNTQICMCVHICIYIDTICSTIKASFNI